MIVPIAREQWPALAIGFVGLSAGLYGLVRLLRPQLLRRNPDYTEEEFEAYEGMLKKACPGYGECSDAKKAFERKRGECNAIPEDAKRLRRRVERILADHQRALDQITGQRVLEAGILEQRRADLEREKADLQTFLRESGGRAPTQSELHFIDDLSKLVKSSEERLRFNEQEEERLTQILIDQQRYNQEYLREVEEKETELSARCEAEWDALLHVAHDVCQKTRDCKLKQVPLEDWARKRRYRRARKVPEPYEVPMQGDLAAFGVEIEAVMPPTTASTGYVQDYVARELAKKLGWAHESYPPRVFDEKGREWKVEHDGSLASGGFELVTPVLSPGDIGLVQHVAKALQSMGARSGPQYGAGLHVHVSHPTQRKRLAAIAREAKRLDERTPRHPSRLSYADHIPERFFDRVTPGMDDEEVLKLWYSSQGVDMPDPHDVDKASPARYRAVNFHALPYMETIEVRAFDGTLDPEKIKSAVMEALKLITTRAYENGRRRRKRRRRWT